MFTPRFRFLAINPAANTRRSLRSRQEICRLRIEATPPREARSQQSYTAHSSYPCKQKRHTPKPTVDFATPFGASSERLRCVPRRCVLVSPVASREAWNGLTSTVQRGGWGDQSETTWKPLQGMEPEPEAGWPFSTPSLPGSSYGWRRAK